MDIFSILEMYGTGMERAHEHLNGVSDAVTCIGREGVRRMMHAGRVPLVHRHLLVLVALVDFPLISGRYP